MENCPSKNLTFLKNFSVASIYSKHRFKKSTVGLVTAEEFKRRRDIIE
jgi:hypothetical protein